MLHTSIGIGINSGKYYWTLGGFLGIVLAPPKGIVFYCQICSKCQISKVTLQVQ